MDVDHPHREPSALLASKGRSPTILIVEDDADLAAEMATMLEDYGMRPALARDWPSAQAFFETGTADLVLLDQRLGAVDAVPLIPQLRRATAAPVIVLTGNRAEVDRIVALEIGADDFLLKPISGRELVARIRARLRGSAETAAPAQAADWRFDAVARTLHRPDGTEVGLTAAEFDLLAALVSQAGEPLPRETLTQRILGRPWRPDDRALDNLVLHLRKKLAPGGDRAIATIRNRGYVFTAFPRD